MSFVCVLLLSLYTRYSQELDGGSAEESAVTAATIDGSALDTSVPAGSNSTAFATSAEDVVYSTVTMKCHVCASTNQSSTHNLTDALVAAVGLGAGAGTGAGLELCRCRPALQLNANYNLLLATVGLSVSSLAYAYVPAHRAANPAFLAAFKSTAVGKQVTASEASGSPLLPSSMLILGLGGAELHNFMIGYYPNMTVTTVEVSQAVVDTAQSYFGLEACQVLSLAEAVATQQATSAGTPGTPGTPSSCRSRVIVGSAEDAVIQLARPSTSTNETGKGAVFVAAAGYDYLVSDVYDLLTGYWFASDMDENLQSNPSWVVDLVSRSKALLNRNRGVAMFYVHSDAMLPKIIAAVKENFAGKLQLSCCSVCFVAVVSIFLTWKTRSCRHRYGGVVPEQ